MCWSSLFVEELFYFVRSDRVYLNVVYMSGGECKFRRVVATSAQNEHREPCIMFTLDPSYRIKEGHQRGRIVLQDAVEEGVDASRAGLYKFLRWGTNSWCFNSERRKGDLSLEPMFNSFMSFQEEEEIFLPGLYLTCFEGQEDLRLRQSAGVDNIETSKLDAGGGRVAYPYEDVTGAGTVAMDMPGGIDDVFGPWEWVPSIEVDLPYLKITAGIEGAIHDA